MCYCIITERETKKKARITGSATNCVCIKKNVSEFDTEKFEETGLLPLLAFPQFPSFHLFFIFLYIEKYIYTMK